MQNLFVRSIEIANMLGLLLGAVGLYFSSKKKIVRILSISASVIFGLLFLLFIVLLIRDFWRYGWNIIPRQF